MIDLAREWSAHPRHQPGPFRVSDVIGIRPRPADKLVNDGYRLRIYVPFGREWFPYFMRRLGERPANVLFVLRGSPSVAEKSLAVGKLNTYSKTGQGGDFAANQFRPNVYGDRSSSACLVDIT